MVDFELALGKLWRANPGGLPSPSYRYRMVESTPIEGIDHLTGALTKIG